MTSVKISKSDESQGALSVNFNNLLFVLSSIKELFKQSEKIINKELEQCDTLKEDLTDERKTTLIKRKMQKKDASIDKTQPDKLKELIETRKEHITFTKNKYGHFEYQSLILDNNVIIGKQDPKSETILPLSLDDIEKCKSLKLTFSYPDNLAVTVSSKPIKNNAPEIEDPLYENLSDDEEDD